MSLSQIFDPKFATHIDDLRAKGQAFAIATVVRTVDATAAKPGAKALLLQDGSIKDGWIGGGCIRAALRRATLDALADGQPKFISLRPEDVLADEGVKAGEERKGVRFARNGCPSKGSMDIFVEPVLPQPELVIYGDSPVAHALAQLATGFDFDLSLTTDPTTLTELRANAGRCVVVASQGKGDLDFLMAALAGNAGYIAFVGSARKFTALREKSLKLGADAAVLDTVSAPAGLHISAVTPKEIALSILAQIVQHRRQNQRHPHPSAT